MGTIKRKPIIISIISFLAIVIGLSITFYFKNSMLTPKELPVQQLEHSKINKAAIGAYISSNHKYWNDELCWGRSENYSFTVFQKNYTEYIDDLNQIIYATDDKDLKEDFLLAKDLLENANKTKDIRYLIDVHRILHDLDVKYNKYTTSDYFGVTQYGKKH